MGNVIKSATTVSNGTIKKNNFLIGVNTSLGYGPTSSTGFWNGIVPPTSGYTVYAQKATQGPSVRVASNDSELITIAQQYGGTNINTIYDALNYFNGQSNYLVTNIDYPNIVTSGLTYLLDGGFIPSYPRTGATWNDLSGNGNSTSLVNGPTFNSSNDGSIVFDGVNEYGLTANLLNPTTFPNESVFVWFYPTSAGQIVSELGQATINFGYHDSNIEINSGGVISFATWGGNLTNKVVSSAKSFNTWYQLGFTYSGTTLTAYINGSSIGTATLTRQPPTALYFGLCAIDSVTNMGTAGYAGGRMGNFLFYNRGLSSSEVLQNYNAQKTRFGL
jgi:hypothetical protein